MQKSRGVDFHDDSDPSKYQALDSLVLQKTKSGQKKAMKKMALLNIRECVDESPDLEKKTTDEVRFQERHPELYVGESEKTEAPTEITKEAEEHKDKEFWKIVEDYTVQEPKIWDCYQLFCKLINYKYNPYDDQELEDYIALQELEGKEQLTADQDGSGLGGSMWPFGK
mmetsp:Transcript_1249/g.1390  ORF Transcript_1249/g.1390 Transcript_1249/m.1390 type:complete len:169 (+) Transcript_1249:519-1025(+)